MGEGRGGVEPKELRHMWFRSKEGEGGRVKNTNNNKTTSKKQGIFPKINRINEGYLRTHLPPTHGVDIQNVKVIVSSQCWVVAIYPHLLPIH
jgi:hypothetical protein